MTESFTVVNDTVAPTAAITVPERAGLSFVVEWRGVDPSTGSGQGSGVRGYHVQYREGEEDWADWLTETTAVKATLAGTQGISYTFQVRAIDNVGNEGAWVESDAVEVSDTVTKYYQFGGQRVAMRRGGVVYFIHGDHLGSTSLTTDSAGNVVSEVRYLPYGQERWNNGTAVTDFGFTSQRKEGFGLYDYQARYYSPYLNRFISPDTQVHEPILDLNRYSYVRNNPFKYVDPTGHQSLVLEMIGTGIVLGGTMLLYHYYGAPNAAQNRQALANSFNVVAEGAAEVVEGVIETFPVEEVEAETHLGPSTQPEVQNVEEFPANSDQAPGAGGPDITEKPTPWPNVMESSGIARRIAQGHAYDKHVLEKGEFPEIANPGEFEHLIDDVMNNYDDSKSLTRGRAAYWKDDIVVITNPVDPDGGTAFRPVDGKEYYDNLK